MYACACVPVTSKGPLFTCNALSPQDTHLVHVHVHNIACIYIICMSVIYKLTHLLCISINAKDAHNQIKGKCMCRTIELGSEC